MIYELYLEGQLADIRQDLGMQLSYAIDDINKYGSRETSFSKTIVLPGTANNNRLLGFVSELGSNNTYLSGGANINSNFNPAQTTKAELRANGLLLLKGVFRLTGIVKDGELVEYEGNLFGELGGFISAIGNGKLEDLNFNMYNHVYKRDNIVESWLFDQLYNYSPTLDANINFEKFTGGGLGSAYVSINSILDFQPKGLFVNAKIKFTGTDQDSNTIKNNNKILTIKSFSQDYLGNFDGVDIYETIILIFEDVINDFITGGSITLEIERNGIGYFYPLIDYGRYSAAKLNYDYRTFRPALFVKEYIDKMFLPTGYTYESNFLNTEFFNSLVIPNNTASLKKIVSKLLDVSSPNGYEIRNISVSKITYFHAFQIISVINNFSNSNNTTFTYNGTNIEANLNFSANGYYEDTDYEFSGFIYVLLLKNDQPIYQVGYEFINNRQNFNINFNTTLQINTNDTFKLRIDVQTAYIYFENILLDIQSTNPVTAPIVLNDNIIFSDILPKNILQKDFFTWIMKMFNLYITEDKLKEKHLIIEPYKDYYDLTEYEDWTYKVARDKPWNIKPMGMLNGRFFEYKYKEDNDFYNEGYKKKYNLPYGSNLQDTGFQFAKDKQTTEIGFSPTPLVKYSGEDKVVSAIYKVSKGNDVDQEEQTDSNIRILMVKKITGVDAWYITDNGADLQQPPTNLGGSLTGYGYAGHFDDPTDPTVDINFGAAEEIYCQPNTYPSNNLFNTYWSGYIAEIADKDSKILTCHVYLTELDIAQLDFSKPVFIDGSLWRINKIIDFDASSGELTKVELLKVINNG